MEQGYDMGTSVPNATEKKGIGTWNSKVLRKQMSAFYRMTANSRKRSTGYRDVIDLLTK